MKISKIILLILFLLILNYVFSSCEKLVEVDLPANQLSSGQVFENTQTANAALSELYAGLWESSPIAGNQTGPLLGTYTDDLDFYAMNSNTGIVEVFQNTLIDSNPAVYSYWSSAYQKLYIANSIIEGVEHSVSLPDADRKRIKGEALLVRSILFYYLEQIYGDIPLVTTTDYTVNQFLAKTSSNDALNKIEDDLNESVILLTDDYRHAERIYPNKKVAQLMLAKVYMLRQKWQDAEIQLKSIVQSPLYQFQNDLTKVFKKSGKHILWQLKPKNEGNATKEAIEYYFSGAAPTGTALSSNLVNTFTAMDRRKDNWIATVTIGSNTWYRADKYKNRTINPDEYSVVFRLEEVYLLLAESLAQQDKIGEALPYINATRQRATLVPLVIPIGKQSLLNEILLEDRKEFFTEMGHRFLDLKRFDRLNGLSAVKPNWQNFHRVWPLPQKELLLNPNMNPQNTGY
ncbi:RagB/SusD family nutrient uptake outer membrane protein [Chryseobacterium sp. c4a]|uniref:RagB/SusD family nutrient uptake outer membrane protein n=1 Tax=Chryseobacterium sp. c4a TaxID=1573582 RepID=UPI00135B71E9|nr:RagB/SusD family nutrient uptake outer membrane protein [Chryseobacterium sp. c4a]